MTRTIKLPYDSPGSFAELLADLRRRQSRLMRFTYCRLVEGVAQRDLYQRVRGHPVGQGLHTWLILSALKKAKALYERFPVGGIVFGGKAALRDRATDKLTSVDWKARRLQPLYIEGHAKSYGAQGGNHLITLDLARRQVIFHGSGGQDFALSLRLSHRSKTYYRRLIDLQARCETLRDTPFTVSLSEKEIAISWAEPKPLPRASLTGRVLALDLNPTKLGWAVVDALPGETGLCRCAAWGCFEYPGLGRRLGVASHDPRAIAQRQKRRHELTILAKEIELLAVQYQVAAVITERLGLGAKDHGKGRAFNRLINQVWFRRALSEPLLRRLAVGGIEHREINPAFSSKIGNQLWADPLRIPDPACAAVELARRALWPASFPSPQKVASQLSKPNARRQRKDGARVSARTGRTLGGWRRVWSQLQPKAADTRRRSRADLRPLLSPGNPRLAPLVNPRSKVLRFEPREGASAPFGSQLHKLSLALAANRDL